MRFRIEHSTTLFFNQPVSEQAGELRFLPRQESYQKVLSFQLRLEPEAELFHYRDAFGNHVQHFALLAPHDRLQIHFNAEVENHLENPFNYLPPGPAEERRHIQAMLLQNPRLNDFVLSVSETVPSLKSAAFGIDWPRYDPDKDLLQCVQEAMAWLGKEFQYIPGTTSVHAPFQDVLQNKAGVCQDFSHLLIAIVRSWGFPARYVMGYQYLPPGKDSELNPATHAWTEVFLPGLGWQGFDVTQQLLANHTYIPVAVGRDSHDAAPQRGCYKGSAVGQEPEIELRVLGQQ